MLCTRAGLLSAVCVVGRHVRVCASGQGVWCVGAKVQTTQVLHSQLLTLCLLHTTTQVPNFSTDTRENPPRTILCQLFSHVNLSSSNLNNTVQTPALVPMLLFGGSVGPAEEGEFGEYFFNQINYCWETSHFSPFNLYSMGNPSNTPAQSVRQDQRDAVSNQGGRQKMGWSAGNEQTTGGKGSGKACREEGKPRDVSAAPQTREDGRKWVSLLAN